MRRAVPCRHLGADPPGRTVRRSRGIAVLRGGWVLMLVLLATGWPPPARAWTATTTTTGRVGPQGRTGRGRSWLLGAAAADTGGPTDSTSGGGAANPVSRTEYTIDDAVCPRTRPHLLESTVKRACASLGTFLERKPIAGHTRAAHEALVGLVGRDRLASTPVVLDSGCGTGRSTRLLAERFPDHLVVGVDRSFQRLSQNHRQTRTTTNNANNTNTNTNDNNESKRPLCEQVSGNAFLVRAELVDFWRCCHADGWNIEHHYLLYPNPYPTSTRLTQRWYAHPSFPLLLGLGADTITVRSNWEGYLKEFARAVEIAASSEEGPARAYAASAREGPSQRTDQRLALTNFEQKYDRAGEPTYELCLRAARTGTSS